MPTKIKLIMPDGYTLGINIFEPKNPKAIILVGSALGIGQYFYFGIAKYLSAKGYVVITHDYRGTGESAPAKLNRGFDAGFAKLGEDFDALFNWTKQTYFELPITLIGHSLGGIIPMLSPNISVIKAAYLVGCQTAYFKDFGYSKSQAIKIRALWHILVPFLTKSYGYFPSKKLGLNMENIPYKIMAEIQFRRKHLEATDFLKAIGVNSRHLDLRCPVYAVTATDDPICTPKAMDRLLSDFENAEIEHQLLNPEKINTGYIGHAGFFRKQNKEMLWGQVGEWLDEKIGKEKITKIHSAA